MPEQSISELIDSEQFGAALKSIDTTTTTFEALWMNVPEISVCGDTHASRVGQSILRYAGIGELAATSRNGYVNKAVQLAADPDRLANYRQTLRTRLSTCSLTDPSRFARSVGRLLRRRYIGMPVVVTFL